MEAIALLLVLLSCFCAWIALSLGLAKHQSAALGRTLAPAASRRLRALGWALLATGLVLMVLTRGWELGPVLWACALMVTAVVWTLVLTGLSAAPHS